MHPQPFRVSSGVGGSAGPDLSAPSVESSWLLKAKVLVPELPAGYVSRASLQQRFKGVLERRLTVLQAPAGFGKTTALADVVRHRKQQGVVVAWVSLDDDDTPNLLGGYLAYAFEEAGLDRALLRAHDAWNQSLAVQQMGMLARAIGLHEAPCLLVLDELDRLPRRTVQLVQLLLRRAPRNLHLALAFRVNPGLELATHLLDGGAVVDAEALRFSTDDIARFFDGSLPDAELAALEERTAGWPVALTVYRNTRAAEGKLLGADAAQITTNYIGMRLLGDLSKEDRGCLLDLAVFDWIDAELVDDVLGSSAARLRVVSSSSLHGLLPPVDTDVSVRRLHQLVRDHCFHVLSVENPVRKRSLHKQIAQALARRGQLTASWRHASAAGDNRLVGDLIERYGVCRLWLREGVTRLISAGRFLTPEITARYPRLDLLRCLILCLSSRRPEAAARFEAISQRTDGFARDRDEGDVDALALDRVFTQLALVGGADCLLPADLDWRLPAGNLGDERGRTLACARHTLLCVACYERASFEESRRHGLQAQACSTEHTRFGEVFVDACLGMAAMAQGRVEEAGRRYRRARRGGQEVLLLRSLPHGEHRRAADRARSRAEPREGGPAAHSEEPDGVAGSLGRRLHDGGRGERRADARAVRQPGGHQAAVEGGRRRAGRRYREPVEAHAGAAGVLPGGGGTPGRGWTGVARPRVAVRRVRAARSRVPVLAHDGGAVLRTGPVAGGTGRVGRRRSTCERLVHGCIGARFDPHAAKGTGAVDGRRSPRGTAGSGARSSGRFPSYRARHGLHEAAGAPSHRQPDAPSSAARHGPGRGSAGDVESMQATVDGSATGDEQLFSTRELDVLSEAARGLRSKEIGGRLGISDQGVRYHLKNIYRKAGVGKRADAIKYAQSLGVLT